MKRRKFIMLLGGAAAWPLTAHAQQAGDIVRIGVLNTGLDDAVSGGLGYRAFVAELQKLGFVEGRNLVIDYGQMLVSLTETSSPAKWMFPAANCVVVFIPPMW